MHCAEAALCGLAGWMRSKFRSLRSTCWPSNGGNHACAAEEWSEDDLFNLVRRAWPYRNLAREEFNRIVTMLSDGITPANRAAIRLHRDVMAGRLKARRGARIVAITCGGAIPELGDFRVVTENDGTFVGTVNEDFALESNSGDVFLLGNTLWRVRHGAARWFT